MPGRYVHSRDASGNPSRICGRRAASASKAHHCHCQQAEQAGHTAPEGSFHGANLCAARPHGKRVPRRGHPPGVGRSVWRILHDGNVTRPGVRAPAISPRVAVSPSRALRVACASGVMQCSKMIPGTLRNGNEAWLGVCAAAVMGFQSLAAGADWPAWRGAAAQGAAGPGRYPVAWSADSIAWKVPLPGKGTSTPIVSNGRIYVTSPSDGEDAVLAFDLDGKKLWEARLGPLSDPKHRSLASSCNASPVTDGEAVYVYFRSGHFAAVNTDGTVRWKRNLTDQFGTENLFGTRGRRRWWLETWYC